MVATPENAQQPAVCNFFAAAQDEDRGDPVRNDAFIGIGAELVMPGLVPSFAKASAD
jgi:hypothetical protein